MDYLLAAVHRGPYLSIAPLEKALGSKRCAFMLDQTAAAERRLRGGAVLSEPEDLLGFLRKHRPKAIVRGISKTPEARNLETRLTAAARKAGVAVYVVEDFPGNYHDRKGEPIAGLFVEYEYCRKLHAARGCDPKKIHVVGNPRYASLAPRPSEAKLAARRRAWGVPRPIVLWAGQPHGGPNRATLRALWPALEAAGASVVLRRHPLDRSGPYRFRGNVPFVDASGEPDPMEAAAAADLVLTQFSTLAIEAGFVGTPCVLAVLPGIGDDYLKRMAGGQTQTPWGASGCAWELRDVSNAKAVLKIALRDGAARKRRLSVFAHMRATSSNSAKLMASIIRRPAI